LGDFIISLTAVDFVRRKYGCEPVTVVARGSLGELTVALGVAHRGIDLETAALHPLFTQGGHAALTADRRTWLGQFGLILHFFGPQQSVVTQSLAQACRVRVHGIDPTPPDDWTGHTSEFHIYQIEHRPTDAQPPPNVELDQGLFERTRTTIGGKFERPLAVIHPGSGGLAKCWTMNKFMDLAARLSDDGMKSIFVLGPVERETWPADRVNVLSSKFRVAPELSLPELAAALCLANVFIGNDSGPAHLAALLGTPTVALFGPTSPALWRPLGKNVDVISPPNESSIDDISVDRVAEAVRVAIADG
jgi:hypothetical protein